VSVTPRSVSPPRQRDDERTVTNDTPDAAGWHRLFEGNTFGLFLVLLVICATFTAIRPHAFATVFEARTVATNAAVLMVIAVGMTFVIVTGGIDLSVGAVLVFSGVIAARVMRAGSASSLNDGWGIIAVGGIAALGSGLCWGVLNGVLVAKAKVPALIVTLGTLGAALGLAQILADDQDMHGIPARLNAQLGYGRVLGIPPLVIVAAVVTLVGGVTLVATRFGRHTTAIGSSAEASRRAGINVDRHLVAIYALQGTLAGLAGFLALAFYDTTGLSGHSFDSLNAITAVVIGGTSLFGGRGTIVGTAIGVFIPAVLSSGLNIVEVDASWQNVAVGAVLVIAVYIDQLRRRRREAH